MLIGFDDHLVARFIQIHQEMLIGRTSWEFERYGNVEILQFSTVCIVIRQSEDGPMIVMVGAV